MDHLRRLGVRLNLRCGFLVHLHHGTFRLFYALQVLQHALRGLQLQAQSLLQTRLFRFVYGSLQRGQVAGRHGRVQFCREYTTLGLKGRICHFRKWQIRHFNPKGMNFIKHDYLPDSILPLYNFIHICHSIIH